MTILQGFLAGFGGALLFLFFVVGAHPTNLGSVLFMGIVVGGITAYYFYKKEERERHARLLEREQAEQQEETE